MAIVGSNVIQLYDTGGSIQLNRICLKATGGVTVAAALAPYIKYADVKNIASDATSMTIELTLSEARSVDYASITSNGSTKYYFVDGHMRGTADFTRVRLTLDVLNSYAHVIRGGLIDRAHMPRYTYNPSTSSFEPTLYRSLMLNYTPIYPMAKRIIEVISMPTYTPEDNQYVCALAVSSQVWEPDTGQSRRLIYPGIYTIDASEDSLGAWMKIAGAPGTYQSVSTWAWGFTSGISQGDGDIYKSSLVISVNYVPYAPFADSIVSGTPNRRVFDGNIKKIKLDATVPSGTETCYNGITAVTKYGTIGSTRLIGIKSITDVIYDYGIGLSLACNAKLGSSNTSNTNTWDDPAILGALPLGIGRRNLSLDIPVRMLASSTALYYTVNSDPNSTFSIKTYDYLGQPSKLTFTEAIRASVGYDSYEDYNMKNPASPPWMRTLTSVVNTLKPSSLIEGTSQLGTVTRGINNAQAAANQEAQLKLTADGIVDGTNLLDAIDTQNFYLYYFFYQPDSKDLNAMKDECYRFGYAYGKYESAVSFQIETYWKRYSLNFIQGRSFTFTTLGDVNVHEALQKQYEEGVNWVWTDTIALNGRSLKDIATLYAKNNERSP